MWAPRSGAPPSILQVRLPLFASAFVGADSCHWPAMAKATVCVTQGNIHVGPWGPSFLLCFSSLQRTRCMCCEHVEIWQLNSLFVWQTLIAPISLFSRKRRERGLFLSRAPRAVLCVLLNHPRHWDDRLLCEKGQHEGVLQSRRSTEIESVAGIGNAQPQTLFISLEPSFHSTGKARAESWLPDTVDSQREMAAQASGCDPKPRANFLPENTGSSTEVYGLEQSLDVYIQCQDLYICQIKLCPSKNAWNSSTCKGELSNNSTVLPGLVGLT